MHIVTVHVMYGLVRRGKKVAHLIHRKIQYCVITGATLSTNGVRSIKHFRSRRMRIMEYIISSRYILTNVNYFSPYV